MAHRALPPCHRPFCGSHVPGSPEYPAFLLNVTPATSNWDYVTFLSVPSGIYFQLNMLSIPILQYVSSHSIQPRSFCQLPPTYYVRNKLWNLWNTPNVKHHTLTLKRKQQNTWVWTVKLLPHGIMQLWVHFSFLISLIFFPFYTQFII